MEDVEDVEDGEVGATAVGGPEQDAGDNRELWTRANAEYTDQRAREAWAAADISWGDFGAPEHELAAVGDVAGLDVVELGCGTAYFSAWLARRGARPVGVDVTPAQLATARRCQEHFGITFPLIEADAGSVPLPDAGFDLAVSEYGASTWCDPARWVPEAARLLRPGGRLVFLTVSVLAMLCTPDDAFPGGSAEDRLVRSQQKLYRRANTDGGVEFHPSHSEWIRLLRANGFSVDALHEIHAAPDAVDHPYYDAVSADWARRWPAEDLWIAHLPGEDQRGLATESPNGG